MSDSAWTAGATRASRTGLRTRPRYGAGDVIPLLWRERLLVLTVFIVVLAIGLAVAFLMKTTYDAQSSILVRLGQAYVYQPRAGNAAQGAVPESDQVLQSEVEILSSAQVKERVLERLGLARVFPALGRGYDTASPDERRIREGKAVVAMERNLKIATTPGAPVIRLDYLDRDPQTAAQVLNALMDEYLVYRRAILLDPTAPLEEQRKAFEARLAEADEAYESFLGSNNIGDFETEKSSLAQLQATLQQQKYANDAQLTDREGRVAALSAQASALPQEVGLYRDVDHTAQDKLSQLKVQREDLLSRYRPDSQPVRDVDDQIATLEAAIGAGSVQGDGARRIGANPVYQTVQTDRIQLTAEVAALKQASATLGQQIEQVTERQLRLAQLEPRYDALSRDRDVLSGNVKDFTQKEQDAEAADAIARQSNDNIAIIERAVTPAQGKSLKAPVALLALVLAAFAAGCVGLVRGLTRPGFPTPSSAGRTLELPVLASAGLKPAR
ncbi:MAG TPA: Wzz/FepE/Etk N-terminal domain-containing protein [Caulobacteraceae bacterium]|nr:Wzz/FepE/Etk N-terminal domain-containing protein [Caulobacteraceae bacterium]